MGRDNKQGKSKSKDSLPQTPKNQKITPNEIQAEFAREFSELKQNNLNQKRKK